MVAFYFICAIDCHFVASQPHPARCKLCLHFARLLLKMALELLIDCHFVALQSQPARCKRLLGVKNDSGIPKSFLFFLLLSLLL